MLKRLIRSIYAIFAGQFLNPHPRECGVVCALYRTRYSRAQGGGFLFEGDSPVTACLSRGRRVHLQVGVISH